MKPAIARRTTECHYCHEVISPGSDRLDDVVKSKTFYRRLHYHPQCFADKATKWFDENRDKVPTYAHGGGRPPLDLTTEEKELRHKILIKLRNLFTYYLPKLNLQTPTDQLEYADLKVMLNFQHRFHSLAQSLIPLGGLPSRYKDIRIPDISEAIATVVGIDNNSDIVDAVNESLC